MSSTRSLVGVLAATLSLAPVVSEAQQAGVDSRPPNATGQTPAFPGQTRAPEQKSGVAFDVVTVAQGLVNPWGMTFLPDGRILVTERAGRLRIVSASGALSEAVAGLPAVAARGQGGLLDVELHPDFPAARWEGLNAHPYTGAGHRDPDGKWSGPEVWERGFVTRYAMKNRHEDFAELVELAFTEPQRARQLARHSDVLARKLELAATAYERLVPGLVVPWAR